MPLEAGRLSKQRPCLMCMRIQAMPAKGLKRVKNCEPGSARGGEIQHAGCRRARTESHHSRQAVDLHQRKMSRLTDVLT